MYVANASFPRKSNLMLSFDILIINHSIQTYHLTYHFAFYDYYSHKMINEILREFSNVQYIDVNSFHLWVREIGTNIKMHFAKICKSYSRKIIAFVLECSYGIAICNAAKQLQIFSASCYLAGFCLILSVANTNNAIT